MKVNMSHKLENYFNVTEFEQLLSELKNKYITYGKCTGIIKVKPKNEQEALKLSKFLAKNIKVGKETNIKINDIQKSLNDSIFEGTTVDDLVLLFYPNIKSKKELKIETDNLINEKLTNYQKKYNLDKLLVNSEAIKKIKYLIIHDEELLNNIFNSLENLPIYKNNIENLSIFASNITGNPHYYDLDTHNSNLLIQFICYLFDFKFDNKRSFKKEILDYVGLLVDEVSNYVITYNLSGNEMLDSFKKHKTPLMINLSNIRKMDNINACNNKLLIIENPSFLSKIIDKEMSYSVIITSGNSNLVIYKLLDKIKNTDIYFNGDFDPEGLLIAQNFKDRYPNIKFIGYDEKLYYKGLSNNKISDIRLKKLDNIKDRDLKIICDLLKIKRLASYQEASYDTILSEVR